MAKIEYDDLLKDIGGFGKYQITLYIAMLFICLPTAFNNVGIVFLAGVPDHWCTAPELRHLNLSDDVIKNLTLPLEEKDGASAFSQCNMYDRNYSDWSLEDVWSSLESETKPEPVACRNGWTYDRSVYTSTVVTQWDLVCADRWLQATAASVYMAGLMAGVIVFGSLADSIGRRPTFAITLVLTVVLMVVVAFSPNFIAFVVLRFFLGFHSIAMFTVGFVIVMELVAPAYRVHAGMGTMYGWAVGYMLYAGLAYGIRDWFTLQLVSSCPCLLLCLFIIIVPESIRWLYVNNKTEQAEALVRKTAKVNKKLLPDKLEVITQVEARKYIWDLFRSRRLALRTVNVYFNWFVNSLVYYGLSLNTSNLGGNDFVNFFISGAIEIPSYALTEVALVYLGRRWPLFGSMFFGGASLLCTLAVPAHLQWLSITLAMLGKFGISASFAIIYVFTAEMYPTPVRSVAVSSGSMFARLGGVVAPYIAQMADFSRVIPPVVFGVLSITAALLALAYPETKDRNLPQTMEDGENFGRDNNAKEENGHVNPSYEEENTRI